MNNLFLHVYIDLLDTSIDFHVLEILLQALYSYLVGIIKVWNEFAVIEPQRF